MDRQAATDSVLRLIASSPRAGTEAHIATELGMAPRFVRDRWAGLFFDRRIVNCLVRDGAYSGGYYVDGLCQRVPSQLRRVFSAGQPSARRRL